MLTLNQLVPSLILAHPLPLLPLLALLPYNFLPAGVVFFIPIICILAVLSSCAHIVIVYLAWCVSSLGRTADLIQVSQSAHICKGVRNCHWEIWKARFMGRANSRDCRHHGFTCLMAGK